ncbi:MAG: hypothetical protein JW929_16565 [Anaerolineales bacterium]|nr:hypothetical protein [Anaerolineales bacterium]
MAGRIRVWVFISLIGVAAGCAPAADAAAGTPATIVAYLTRNAATKIATMSAAVRKPTPQPTEASVTKTTLAITPLPLAAGSAHTCMIADKGAIRCWGNNQSGQLGNATTGKASLPVETGAVPGGAAALAAGKNHTCALSAGGEVYCWGANGRGQLGDGTSDDRAVPAPVAGLQEKTVMLAAGDSFTCALSESGTVRCWGWNAEGQLGDGGEGDRSLPVGVSGLGGGIRSIAAGKAHACALRGTGGVACWGRGYEGQLGDGLRKASRTPVDVSGLRDGAEAVAAGGTYSCAFLTDQKAVCWGYNVYVPGDKNEYAVPNETRMLPQRPAAIGMGANFACLLTGAGGVQCWGTNRYGQLGNGTKLDATEKPLFVKGLEQGAAFLAVGMQHACALTNGGEIRCWGANDSYQLGADAPVAAYAPVAAGFPTLHHYYSGIEAAAPPEDDPLRYPSLWSLTEGYQGLSVPGVTTYTVRVPRGSVWDLDFYQCASDAETLERLLSAVAVTLLVDYQPVSEQAVRVFRRRYDSWACQGWATTLSQWENAEYEIGILAEVGADAYDGEKTYAVGNYWRIFMVTVEE